MTFHLPAETAMALAMALTDVRYDLHAKRTAAEQAIEDLIQFLDDTEGDADLEPSLGCGGYSRYGEECDLEGDGDCDEEDGDQDSCVSDGLHDAPEPGSMSGDDWNATMTIRGGGSEAA